MIRHITSAILMLVLIAGASAIIESPQNTTYGPSVPIMLVSEEPADLSYTLNGESGGCTSCTQYDETLVLADGTYTLNATNETHSENVTFTVLTLRAFSVYERGILYASSNKNANLSYAIDGSEEALLCEECSEANTTLELEAGTHTISVFARLEDEEANETYDIVIADAFELTVTDPQNETYVRRAPLTVSTNHEANITYTIADETIVLCEDCTEADATLELDAGHYTVLIEANHNDEVLNETVSFTIADFSVKIESPQPRTYTGSLPFSVLVNVTASDTLDSIEATLDGSEFSCASCSALTRTVSLDEGDYTIRVTGTLSGETHEANVTFSVRAQPSEEPDEPRFTTGLQHLPQAVERGDYTDEQLARIIRENELNPGVLNRLIKTGMLGEQSIDAILETQFAPPGILWRLLGWLGIGRPSVPEAVAQHYDVTESQAQTIAVRPDTPPGLAKRVVEEAQGRVPPEQNGRIPPGQARKTEETNDEHEASAEEPRAIGSQKIPPGLAKRNGAPGNSANAPGRT